MTGTSTLPIRVHPGAKRDAIRWDPARGWALSIAAPATDGRANDRVCAFLAREVLDLPARGVRVRMGHTARQKLLEIDLSAEQVEQGLRAWCDRA